MLEIDISQGRVTGGIDLVALNPLDNFFSLISKWD
jgi:hypothetical protein